MTGILKIIQGLPGSGKSTIAEEYVSKDPKNRVIVNRDNIRTELFGARYHKNTPNKEAEEKVNEVQFARIKDALILGKEVISDDTNLNTNTIDFLVSIADEAGAQYEFMPINVPIETAIERNKNRGKSGGRFVPLVAIKNMFATSHNPISGEIKEMQKSKTGYEFVNPYESGAEIVREYNYVLKWNVPVISKNAVIVDVDGTLANNAHLAAFYLNNPNKKRDFDGFFHSILRAPHNREVRDLANSMRENEGITIIILTGRSESYGEELVHFLVRSRINASIVIANNGGDERDYDFKKRKVAEIQREFNIVAAIDDRPESIALWDELGIHVEKVHYFSEPYDEENKMRYFNVPPMSPRYGSGKCLKCGNAVSSGNFHNDCLK